MKKLSLVLILALFVLMTACFGGSEPAPKPVTADEVLLNEINGSWTIATIDGQTVEEYAAGHGLRAFEAAGNMTVSEDGKTVTLTDCDKTESSDIKLGLTGFSLLNKDGEKTADANYSYENKTITLKFSTDSENVLVYKRGLFDFSSPNFVEGVTAELTSVTSAMIAGDWTVETINAMATDAYAKTLNTDESRVIVNADVDDAGTSITLTDSISTATYGLTLKSDGFDILNDNGSVYATATYSFVNQRFSYSLVVEDVEFKYVFKRGKYDFAMNVYVDGLGNETPIPVETIAGEWRCQSVNGLTPEEFAEQNGAALPDVENNLTISADGKTATFENSAERAIYDIVLKSNGFEVLNPDGKVFFSVRYSSAADTLNYKASVIDAEMSYVMERGHFDLDEIPTDSDLRVTAPPETELPAEAADTLEDFGEDTAAPEDEEIIVSADGVLKDEIVAGGTAETAATTPLPGENLDE